MKRWFLPAAARARGQSNDLNREILASNLFNCCKEVINAPPVPSISRCIHIFYRHKNVSEYQWSNFIYNCMSTFLHYVHCKDALLDCSAPGGERCESLTRVDEIIYNLRKYHFPVCKIISQNHEKTPFLHLFVKVVNIFIIYKYRSRPLGTDYIVWPIHSLTHSSIPSLNDRSINDQLVDDCSLLTNAFKNKRGHSTLPLDKWRRHGIPLW